MNRVWKRLTAGVITGVLLIGTTAAPALAGPGQGPNGNGRGNGHFKAKGKFQSQFQDWDALFWGNQALARLVVLGVMKGNADGTIAAQRPVSRLEAATMLTRLLKAEGSGSAGAEQSFADGHLVPAWGLGAVRAGLRLGFLIHEAKHLAVFQPLTRLEAAMMLVKAAGLDAEAQARAGARLAFKDANAVPAFLRGYVAVAVEEGLLLGYEDGTFRPNKPVTRAEWAALLDRFDRGGRVEHPADEQLAGEVVAVSDSAITVKTAGSPRGVAYPLDEDVAVFADGSSAALDDVRAGDQVLLNFNANHLVELITVSERTRAVSGTITAINSSRTRLTLAVGDQLKSYTLAAGATIWRIDGSRGSSTDLHVGDSVAADLEDGKLTRIEITAEATLAVDGELTAIDRTGSTRSVTVKKSSGATATYRLATDVAVAAADGDELALADLRVGDQVTLELRDNKAVKITVTSAAITEVEGEVVAVDASGSVRSVTIQSGTTVTAYHTAPGVVVEDEAGEAIALADVAVGDEVRLELSGNLVVKVAILGV